MGSTRLLSIALAQPLRWYLRYIPLVYGRTRLMSWAARLLDNTPQLSRARDGRKFMLQFPRDRGWERLCFTGTFETGTTDVLRNVLRPDDITFDIGANIGWYTTLLGLQCPRGHCHAFEPEPGIFSELVANCRLNGIGTNVTLNNLGVAEKPGTATIYRFAELPHGHSSMSPAVGGRHHASVCQLTTLDRYCKERGIDRIDLIKIDVEGAELLVLRAAEHVFSLKHPPVWVLEVNFATSQAFGYTPHDLLQFIAEQGDLRFYRIAEGWGKLLLLRGFDECVHGDNILCVPSERLDRLRDLA